MFVPMTMARGIVPSPQTMLVIGLLQTIYCLDCCIIDLYDRIRHGTGQYPFTHPYILPAQPLQAQPCSSPWRYLRRLD